MSEIAKSAGMCMLCARPIYVGDAIQTWEVQGIMTAQHKKCTQDRMQGASAQTSPQPNETVEVGTVTAFTQEAADALGVERFVTTPAIIRRGSPSPQPDAEMLRIIKALLTFRTHPLGATVLETMRWVEANKDTTHAPGEVARRYLYEYGWLFDAIRKLGVKK